MMNDIELLDRYNADQSEEAFQLLVDRHVNLVYSTALRRVGNASTAEDVTQAVFIILARNASKLSRRTILAGWLYRTTIFTASKMLRAEVRRARREEEAVAMHETDTDSNWQQLAPILDEGLEQLSASDRTAIILRYFHNYDIRQVSETLQISHDAAQKRVNRAVEKLRRWVTRRNVTVSTVTLTALLASASAQGAPSLSAASIIARSLGQAPLSAVVAATIESTLQQLFWIKAKPFVVAVALVLLGATTLSVAVVRSREKPTAIRKNFRYPIPSTAPANPTQGATQITIQLRASGTFGFTATYAADGQSGTTTNGVLPVDLSFRADAFVADIIITGRTGGPISCQIFRGENLVASASHQNQDSLSFKVEGLAGGRGVRVTGNKGKAK